MRFHPSHLGPLSNRWQFLAVFALLASLLLVELSKSRVEPEPAAAAIETPMRRVLVAKAPLEAGKPVSAEHVALEDRPIGTLPADAVDKLEELEGHVAIGPIPASYPLARSLFSKPAEPVEAPKPADPVEERLKLIRRETVGFHINFSSPPPPPGTRIAIMLQGSKGGSVLVADEAWIDETDKKSGARILLRPDTALFFQEAQRLGTFSFLVVPDEGASPFAGKAIGDLELLKAELQKLGGTAEEKPPVVVERNAPPPRPSGYAWVPGESVRYSVGKDGTISVLDRSGAAFPLRDGSTGGAAPRPVETTGGDRPPEEAGGTVVRGLE